jgi:integrase
MEMIQKPSVMIKQLSKQQRDHFRNCKLKMDAALAKANEVISRLSDFSFKRFNSGFLDSPIVSKSVYALYQEVIAKLLEEERVGTASNYQCSLNSLKQYKAKLEFEEVTKGFLMTYEKSLINDGRTLTTVGIYMRPLRAIVNIAISRGYMLKEDYPFGKQHYQIPAGRNVKKALTQQEIAKLSEYPVIEGSRYEMAKDFWLFSYLSNGMNMKDIALLKYEDIDGDYIRFHRAKTKLSTRSFIKQISIYLSPIHKSIIGRQSRKTNTGYLFPILDGTTSAIERQKKIGLFTKMVNVYIGKIASDIGIDKHITTYHARHSFATILKRRGIATEIISESLGHSNTKTTKSYLASFDDDVIKDISNIVTQSIESRE